MKMTRVAKYLLLFICLLAVLLSVFDRVLSYSFKGRVLYRAKITDNNVINVEYLVSKNKMCVIRVILPSANENTYHDIVNHKIDIYNSFYIHVTQEKHVKSVLLDHDYKGYLRNPSGYGGREIGYYVFHITPDDNYAYKNVRLNIIILQVDKDIEYKYGPSIIVVEEHIYK